MLAYKKWPTWEVKAFIAIIVSNLRSCPLMPQPLKCSLYMKNHRPTFSWVVPYCTSLDQEEIEMCSFYLAAPLYLALPKSHGTYLYNTHVSIPFHSL